MPRSWSYSILAPSLAPEVVDTGDLDPHLSEAVCRLAADLIDRDDGRSLSRLDRPLIDQPADGFRQQDSDQVVAGEEERLLERSCGDHDLLGAIAVEHVSGIDGDEPALPDPESATGGDHLDAGNLVVDRVEALVDEHDVAALRCVIPGPGETRVASSDHEHVGAPMLAVEPVRALRMRIDAPEAGHVAQETLVQRPRAPRPDHRPVVEPDRGERAAELVDGSQKVMFQRAEDVLRPHLGARTHRLRADSHARNAVHLHEAVRAVPAAAEKPARAVVLEAAGEDAPARGEQGRSEGIALERLDRLALERERDPAFAIYALARLRRKTHQTAGMSGIAA